VTVRRILLAGRVSGEPLPIAGGAGGDFGQLVTLSVPDGAHSRLWAAFCRPGQLVDRPLVDGDALAIVGTVDPNRRGGAGAMQGPVAVDAVLGIHANGDIFGEFGA
jgi:hypothetical protein